MTLSETKAEASAATIESAQTGQVGKSHPRGSELGATVDRTSASAGIVTSLRSEPSLTYTDLFDDTATQMRSFYVIWPLCSFAMQRIAGRPHSGLHAGTSRP